jgi:hypothetical protein
MSRPLLCPEAHVKSQPPPAASLLLTSSRTAPRKPQTLLRTIVTFVRGARYAAEIFARGAALRDRMKLA